MNATNRIPVSVRITQEDADFIAELKIEGANTPSEKIRELLKQARPCPEHHLWQAIDHHIQEAADQQSEQ